MGVILQFPRLISGDHGVVHVMAREGGGFEIGHESRSGDSWGNFHDFDDAGAAIAAAHRLNREAYGGDCEVYVSPAVLAAVRTHGGR